MDNILGILPFTLSLWTKGMGIDAEKESIIIKTQQKEKKPYYILGALVALSCVFMA